ncbi:Unknown protein, partial [Striga hermonthica]
VLQVSCQYLSATFSYSSRDLCALVISQNVITYSVMLNFLNVQRSARRESDYPTPTQATVVAQFRDYHVEKFSGGDPRLMGEWIQNLRKRIKFKNSRFNSRFTQVKLATCQKICKHSHGYSVMRVFRSVMLRSRIVCLIRQDLSIIFSMSAPRFSNSEESEKSWEILSYEGLLLEVKFNLGGSKKLQVPQVDIRRDEEEPIDNNKSCQDGKPTLSTPRMPCLSHSTLKGCRELVLT